MSPPTPEELAAERWFGGKAGTIATVEVEDRLELGAGAALSILLVDGADRYVWSEGPVASAIAQPGTVPGCGRWVFRHTNVTPVEAGERAIELDQSNTSYVVGEQLVVKLYRRIWPGVHPEVELGRYLTEDAGLDCVPAFAGSLHWGDHAVALVQEYVPGEDGWAWGADAIIAGDVADIARLGAESARLHAALAAYGSSAATVPVAMAAFEHVTPADSTTLASADVVVCQPISQPEATLVASALRLTRAGAWLSRIEGDMIAIISDGAVRWAQLSAQAGGPRRSTGITGLAGLART